MQKAGINHEQEVNVRKTAIVLVAGALSFAALPAEAHNDPSLQAVLDHTRAAEAAKSRAVAEFEEHAVAEGRRDFEKNRGQTGLAVAETAKLIKEADSREERRAAAEAVVAVAKQAGRNETAWGRSARDLNRSSDLQVDVVKGARKDAGRMSTAVEQLEELSTRVPSHAKAGIATAISNVTLDRAAAVKQLRRDATSSAVGSTAKEVATGGIEADVGGQALAIDLLQALRPHLPEESQEGTATALEAIADSLDRQAGGLERAGDNVPADLGEALSRAAERAREAAADARS